MPKKENTIEETGNVHEVFSDLVEREEKRTGLSLDSIESYETFTDDRKNTVVLLFDHFEDFIGAGTACKSPRDKYNRNAGIRRAARRALRSVTVHEKKADGKRVRPDG